jgi:two-component system nitrate/nitrite response regulator NarL
MTSGAGRATIRRVATRVLIVDDHAGFRRVARRLLQTGGYEVVGEAPDGTTGLAAARTLQPDVVLLDVQLPDGDGCQIASTLAAEPASPTVVLISSREATDYGPRLRSCGARGFLSKAEQSHASLAALLRQA